MTLLTRMHQLRTLWMAWWLALALVVAPALGRMHKVLHAPELPQATAWNDAGHALFGDHSVLECLVFDQLNLGCDQPTALAPTPHGLPHAVPAWRSDERTLPAAFTAFEARAPPRVTV